jgi:UTRA domain
MKKVDGVEYLTATEAIKEIGGSRQSFYNNVKPYLRPYHFSSRQAPWYSKREVKALATGKPIRKGTIPITGMFTDWTEHARSLGYDAQTELRSVELVTLPADLAETFHLPPDKVFVKRGRMTTVEGEPICSWDTYYPSEYVGDILPQMRQGTASNIVEHIKEKYGVAIGRVKDRYSTRITTLDELNLFRLLNDEPVLMLQRASWTKDHQILVLFSDMVLLGSWFVIEREEEMHAWDN